MPKPPRNAPASAMVRPPVIVPPQISAAVPEPVLVWATKVLCPHCLRSYDSDILGTKGRIRYRRCRRASCHKTFKDLAEEKHFPEPGNSPLT